MLWLLCMLLLVALLSCCGCCCLSLSCYAVTTHSIVMLWLLLLLALLSYCGCCDCCCRRQHHVHIPNGLPCGTEHRKTAVCSACRTRSRRGCRCTVGESASLRHITAMRIASSVRRPSITRNVSSPSPRCLPSDEPCCIAGSAASVHRWLCCLGCVGCTRRHAAGSAAGAH